MPCTLCFSGTILSLISAFWMKTLTAAVPHHLVSDDPARFPSPFTEHADRLDNVRRRPLLPGYLAGRIVLEGAADDVAERIEDAYLTSEGELRLNPASPEG